jgi:acyl-CoA synthetase (AMP-forming)/AMP-acid ligase II
VLDQVVREAARRFGDSTALVADVAMSYAELDQRVDRRAAALAQAGIRAGDVVALVQPATADYVVNYAALARLGAVTAGVSDRFAERERKAVLDQLNPDLVIDANTQPPDLDRKPPVPTYDPDRPVTIVFTSGTTGTPRGATFCGRQLAAITEMDVGPSWGGGDPVVIATGLPHVGFMTKLPGHLQRGARMHVLQRWRAADVLRTVVDNRIPVIGAVAAQVALLMRQPDFDQQDLSCVRALIVGAGPSPPELVREARARFDAAYSIRYSSTESGGLGTMTAFDAPDEEALHTVGRPRAGTEIRIDDGGVCIRLTGRKTDVYIRGGYNVHPGEVEAVLRSHPDVADLVIVPRPDPVMGEIGVAVVVPRDGTSPPALDALRSYAETQLAAYKLPEAIRIVDMLPLTAMDKVDRRALTDRERQTTP